MRGNLKTDKLNILKMPSGHFALELTEQVSWNSFQSEAENLLSILGGSIIKKTDSIGIRLWRVNIKGVELDLTFDDYPVMMSLESDSEEGDLVISGIKNYFQKNGRQEGRRATHQSPHEGKP